MVLPSFEEASQSDRKEVVMVIGSIVTGTPLEGMNLLPSGSRIFRERVVSFEKEYFWPSGLHVVKS